MFANKPEILGVILGILGYPGIVLGLLGHPGSNFGPPGASWCNSGPPGVFLPPRCRSKPAPVDSGQILDDSGGSPNSFKPALVDEYVFLGGALPLKTSPCRLRAAP